MIKVTEMFYSLQGEGRFAGRPSVFLRVFGCNFQCRGFNMPRDEFTSEPEYIISRFTDDELKTAELPLANTGCDSYISWHPKLKHRSPAMSVDDIVKKLVALTPYDTFEGIDLIITGGEPLLGYQKQYPELLEKLRVKHGLDFVTFETNGTQPLSDSMKEYIRDEYMFNVHFSVSPKLPVSGEKWEDAIKPEIVQEYQEYGIVDLKFVVEDYLDTGDFIRALQQYDIDRSTIGIFLMPQGGTPESYNRNAREVAKLAMNLGVCYSPRLQVDLFKNEWNT